MKKELTTIHDGINAESGLRIEAYQVMMADAQPLVFIIQGQANGAGCLWIRTPTELKKACEVDNVNQWWDDSLKTLLPQRVLATRIRDVCALDDEDYRTALRAMTADFDRAWDLVLTGGLSGRPMEYSYLPNKATRSISVAEDIVTPAAWRELSQNNTVECPSRWLDWIDDLRQQVNLTTGCLTWNFYPQQCLGNVRFVSEWRHASARVPREVTFWVGKLAVGYETSTHVWMTIEHERGCSMVDLTMVQPSVWSDELAALEEEWREAGEPKINPKVELNSRIRRAPPSKWAVIGPVPSDWTYHGLPCSASEIRNHYNAIRRLVKS